MEVSNFVQKVNKIDGVIRTHTEVVTLKNGVYIGNLEHDNVNKDSLYIYTGPNLTGTRINDYFLSIPTETPWKYSIRIIAKVDKAYISYEFTGDQVEAEDINNLQNELVRTQQETNTYIESNDTRVTNTETRIKNVEDNKYDKSETFSKEEVLKKIDDLINGAPGTLDTLNEIAKALGDDPNFSATIINLLATKVDQVTGKQLSTEDFSTEEKVKLAGIEINANNYVHPTTHPATMITTDDEHMLVTKAEKDKWNTNSTIEIVDNLVDGGVAKALSAEQGKVINTSLSEKVNYNWCINGNMHIYQRGIGSITNPAVNTYLADRFGIKFYQVGTFPTTITHSLTALTPGEIPNAMYYYRLSVNGAGVTAPDDSYLLYQAVERGTRNLCGTEKKITISFWARSSITNKKLGINFLQQYGTGGTPSTTENLIGKYVELTTTWQKFSVTVDTNTLVGKTFGTNNDDYFRVAFFYIWGTNIASRVGDTVAETFGGSGTIDIAQVKIELGSIVTPFVPRPESEEIKLCQRYYESGALKGMAFGNNNILLEHNFIARKRSIPVITFRSMLNNTTNKLTNLDTLTDAVFTVNGINISNDSIYNATCSETNLVHGKMFAANYTADAEIY